MRLFVVIMVVKCNLCTSYQRKSATKKTSKSPLVVRKRVFKNMVLSSRVSKKSVKTKPKPQLAKTTTQKSRDARRIAKHLRR